MRPKANQSCEVGERGDGKGVSSPTEAEQRYAVRASVVCVRRGGASHLRIQFLERALALVGEAGYQGRVLHKKE